MIKSGSPRGDIMVTRDTVLGRKEDHVLHCEFIYVLPISRPRTTFKSHPLLHLLHLLFLYVT